MLLITQAAHLMCVCVCVYVHTNGQRSFSFFFFLFRLHISEQQKKVVARKTSNSSQVSHSSIYKSGLEERERERETTQKELNDILTTNNYREHECATADLLCIAMIVVLCERRIYSNFTAELYTHTKWCSTIYLRNKKCWLVQPTSIYSP